MVSCPDAISVFRAECYPCGNSSGVLGIARDLSANTLSSTLAAVCVPRHRHSQQTHMETPGELQVRGSRLRVRLYSGL